MSKLPEVKEKNYIDPVSFEKLAKRVRKSFEEEARYLEEVLNENKNTSRFLYNP